MPAYGKETLMEAFLLSIAARKAELDRLRPLSGDALRQLQKHHDVELTYTSNAIEGNTLTYRETAEVIEHGITVGGKPLRDHLEAVDHYEAILWIRQLASGQEPISEAVVCELHRRIVARSQPSIAGIYSPHARRIAGSPVVFPNPMKVPSLMEAFGRRLERGPDTADATPDAAFHAHYDLTAIHPFSDGNGRTARLLMNLVLMRGGYPPVAVRPEDRARYLASLEESQLSDDWAPFKAFMSKRLDATLADYLDLLRETIVPAPPPPAERKPWG
jgi:Fic family protein